MGRHVIVGTAGHIDHGKTSLIKALTGIDASRLAEEKRRGITIDIGFAHLDLPDLRLGFIDVPGHERFVKNMLAGAAGIDVVLLVVAAGESIKPQTREHFEICRLLGIASGVIAITKSDLADPDLLAVTRMEIEEFVAGSFLDGAAIIPVSAKTGEGLRELVDALARAASQVTAKSSEGHARLPIDRAFSMKGFGAVVTGTLVAGAFHVEQEVYLYPGRRPLRIRGIQVHGEAASTATAGQRTAINLSGIDASEIARGFTLSSCAGLEPVRDFHCRVESLSTAPPIKHRAPVHFHAGTAAGEAEIRFFRGQTVLEPGTSTYARMVLREPLLLLPRDRFIVRRFSPVATIGGGVVLDIAAPARHTTPVARLTEIDRADDQEWIRRLLKESGPGLPIADLVARTGLTEKQIAQSATGAIGVNDWLVDAEWFAAARASLIERVRAFHKTHPLEAGLPKHDLTVPHLDVLLDTPELVLEAGSVRVREYRVTLTDPEAEARLAIETAFESAGLAVPSVDEVLAASGVELARARTLLAILLRENRLIRVGPSMVFHRHALDQLRDSLRSLKGTRMNVGQFKDHAGISRKYAIPLLEHLDRLHVTRREGDLRLVL